MSEMKKYYSKDDSLVEESEETKHGFWWGPFFRYKDVKALETQLQAKEEEIGWRTVEDHPLFVFDKNGNWECTEEGDNQFIAAIETNSGWWIHHCIIEDEIGLCVVCDYYTEPAGYSLEDIEYWKPFPNKPIKLASKTK